MVKLIKNISVWRRAVLLKGSVCVSVRKDRLCDQAAFSCFYRLNERYVGVAKICQDRTSSRNYLKKLTVWNCSLVHQYSKRRSITRLKLTSKTCLQALASMCF